MMNKVFSSWLLPITNGALAIGNFVKILVSFNADLPFIQKHFGAPIRN